MTSLNPEQYREAARCGAQAARHGALAPVMHLGHVNPYVASTLGDWRRKQRLQPVVPRQDAPAALLHAGPEASPRAVGTSSFGMSVRTIPAPSPRLLASLKQPNLSISTLIASAKLAEFTILLRKLVALVHLGNPVIYGYIMHTSSMLRDHL